MGRIGRNREYTRALRNLQGSLVGVEARRRVGESGLKMTYYLGETRAVVEYSHEGWQPYGRRAVELAGCQEPANRQPWLVYRHSIVLVEMVTEALGLIARSMALAPAESAQTLLRWYAALSECAAERSKEE